MINQRKTEIISNLKQCGSTEDRYKFLIDFGRRASPISETKKEEKFLISGCLSKAWLVPEFRAGKVFFEFDSEAAIVKGIMALLIYVYSDSTPDEILTCPPDFLSDGGVTEHLSLNRRNGLASVTKQIMLYAATYKALAKSRH